MPEEKRQIYEFDEFRLDAAKRQLLREGEVVPLYSKAFDLLLLLVRSAGRDLTKDEILESIWPGQILEESNLTVNLIRHSRAAASGFPQIKISQLTNDGRVENAAISPDGKFFVFIHAEKDKKSLRLGQINGEGPIELRASADVIYRGLAFAPDGSSVYYVIEDGSESTHTLYKLPVLGGVPVKMRDQIGSYFAIAPDNKRVAFLRGDTANKTSSVLVSNLDGTNERVVLTLSAIRNLNALNFSWTADGKAITYRDWGSGLWRQPLAGGSPQRIGGLPDEKIYSYGWSRDGKLFAFTRGNEIRDAVLISNSN